MKAIRHERPSSVSRERQLRVPRSHLRLPPRRLIASLLPARVVPQSRPLPLFDIQPSRVDQPPFSAFRRDGSANGGCLASSELRQTLTHPDSQASFDDIQPRLFLAHALIALQISFSSLSLLSPQFP